MVFAAVKKDSDKARAYDVHFFPVFRLSVRGIAAHSPEEACRLAALALDTETLRSAIRENLGRECEFVEEMVEALVDIPCGERPSKSTWFMYSGNTWVKEAITQKEFERMAREVLHRDLARQASDFPVCKASGQNRKKAP